MKVKMASLVILSSLFIAAYADGALFREYPIGEEVEKNNLIIAAVWLPPVEMNKEVSATDDLADLKKKKTGEWIHLEADIHADEGNKNGFGAGEWIPDLRITYTFQNDKGKVEGKFFKMVAKDGPHYGDQLFLPFGKYKLTYRIEPPDSGEFGRHTDPITGVAPWWRAFDVSWDFDFKGVKKR